MPYVLLHLWHTCIGGCFLSFDGIARWRDVYIVDCTLTILYDFCDLVEMILTMLCAARWSASEREEMSGNAVG